MDVEVKINVALLDRAQHLSVAILILAQELLLIFLIELLESSLIYKPIRGLEIVDRHTHKHGLNKSGKSCDKVLLKWNICKKKNVGSFRKLINKL